jgi:hypothetical protein
VLENNEIRERITRTWITTDEWGNGDTCQQVIEVLRIDYVTSHGQVNCSSDVMRLPMELILRSLVTHK